jgi:hypothetical protein
VAVHEYGGLLAEQPGYLFEDDRITGRLDQVMDALGQDSSAGQLFIEKLALAGYSPAYADRYRRPLRIVSEELYRVEGHFPRLIPSSFPTGLPSGIQAVSYRLSLAACGSWRIASSPLDPSAQFLRLIEDQ